MFLFPVLNDSFVKLVRINNSHLNTVIDHNYCIISLEKNSIQLSLFIIKNHNTKCVFQINFCAISSHEIFYLINQHKNISQHISFSHALYMGKEIYKAELSKIFQQIYIQL